MMVVLPGRREDVSVRKDAPVRRNSSACSPKQLPTSRLRPGGTIIVSLVQMDGYLIYRYQMVNMVMCERKKVARG